jgi:hypothetical protein
MNLAIYFPCPGHNLPAARGVLLVELALAGLLFRIFYGKISCVDAEPLPNAMGPLRFIC